MSAESRWEDEDVRKLRGDLSVVMRDRAQLMNRLGDLMVEVAKAEKTLLEINSIRNSIIGAQTVNWSEHVYPLVAVLDAAGLPAEPYPKARAHVGTLIERADAAEARALELGKKLEARVREIVEKIRSFPGPMTTLHDSHVIDEVADMVEEEFGK